MCDVDVKVELLAVVELVGSRMFILLLDETKVMLVFVGVEENDVVLAYRPDIMVAMVDEELRTPVVAFRREIMVEITEELLEKAEVELKLVE